VLNLIRIKKILSSTYLCINLIGIMEILRSLLNFITQYYIRIVIYKKQWN